MEITSQQVSIQEIDADLIVVNLFQGITQPDGATGAVDQALGGAISDLIAGGDFCGKAKETAVLYPRGTIPARRVLLVGLGEQEAFDLKAVRQAAHSAIRRARDLGAAHVATVVHGAGAGGLQPDEAAQALVQASLLSLYRFVDYKSEPPERPDPERLTLVEFDAGRLPLVAEGARRGRIIAEGNALARDLVNHPPNVATPTMLAKTAQRIADQYGLDCQMLEEHAMAELGMGALLAVTRGSERPAKFIILEHKPKGVEGAPIVLAGKGITFDTGGTSLKPSENMYKMKGDMGGAAAVLGAMQAIAALDLPHHVIGLAPCCENQPDGRAYLPGDVLRALNGVTIEVINTDAEGRLILADALAYAARYEPAAVIDLATLTGACVIALGENVAAGLFATDDWLAKKFKDAGKASGERVWRLPLWDEYKKKIASPVADVRNLGGRFDGVGASAIFLKQFIGEHPWVHVDIAGMSYKSSPAKEESATGFGVGLLVQLLQDW